MLCLNVFYYNFDNIYFVLPLGMLTSVTNFASSVSRNMDRLSFDETHMERQEERRRHQPAGISSGLRQGLTGFGLSLLGQSTPWTIFFSLGVTSVKDSLDLIVKLHYLLIMNGSLL